MSNKVDIFQETLPEFKAGHDDIGTTAFQLTRDGSNVGLAFLAKKYIRVKADLTNDDNVYVGHDENVAAGNGIELDAGEYIDIAVDSTDKVWVIGGGADQGYSWLAV